MTEHCHVRLANWETDKNLIRSIRETVFVIEQEVDPELEWDGEDATAIHALAGLIDKPYVATGRLQPSGKIGRMAVIAAWRGRGLGKLILDRLIVAAREAGLSSVYLHAQTHAMAFYQNAGFEPEGGQFDEAGIPHRLMRRSLES